MLALAIVATFDDPQVGPVVCRPLVDRGAGLAESGGHIGPPFSAKTSEHGDCAAGPEAERILARHSEAAWRNAPCFAARRLPAGGGRTIVPPFVVDAFSTISFDRD
jgi:hypothetical protein